MYHIRRDGGKFLQGGDEGLRRVLIPFYQYMNIIDALSDLELALMYTGNFMCSPNMTNLKMAALKSLP